MAVSDRIYQILLVHCLFLVAVLKPSPFPIAGHPGNDPQLSDFGGVEIRPSRRGRSRPVPHLSEN
jgi:hypothetical protein